MSWTKYGLLSLDGPFTNEELDEIWPLLEPSRKMAPRSAISSLKYVAFIPTLQARDVICTIEMRRRLR